MRNVLTFYEVAERFPPFLVRLLARVKRGRPLTTDEIAGRAGFSLIFTQRLSEETSWAGVELNVLRRFTQACGFDFFDFSPPHPLQTYLPA